MHRLQQNKQTGRVKWQKMRPQLDSRTSDDLVNEARNLIPQFNPEWDQPKR